MAGLNWNRSGHTWSAERPHEDGGTRYYTVEDFPGHGQAHLLVSVDEYPVNHLEHYNGQFGSAEEARAAADHLDGMHFVGIGGGYEAMDDDQLNHYRGEAEHRAAVADRIAASHRRATWGESVAEGLARADVERKGKPSPAKQVVQRDDIKLFQPEQSGLEYPVVAQWSDEHGAWQVLKQMDAPKPRRQAGTRDKMRQVAESNGWEHNPNPKGLGADPSVDVFERGGLRAVFGYDSDSGRWLSGFLIDPAVQFPDDGILDEGGGPSKARTWLQS